MENNYFKILIHSYAPLFEENQILRILNFEPKYLSEKNYVFNLDDLSNMWVDSRSVVSENHQNMKN